jgi:nucleoid-associated protein YgaU
MPEAEFDLEKELDEMRQKKREAKQHKAEKAAKSRPETPAELVTTDIEGEILKELEKFSKEKADAEGGEPEAAEAEEGPRIYVVQRGDSLSKIAKEVYGNAGRWREIYEANQDQIQDPNMIRPGWELRIP